MMMKKAILAVDDSRTVLNMVDLYLKKDYQVFATTSGNQALQILQKQTVDLILLDIMMPEMDGLTLLKKIREKKAHRDIPVLFLTSDAHKATVLESFQSGIQGYVLKPVAKEELLKRIKETLERQEEKKQQTEKEEQKQAEEKQKAEKAKKEEKIKEEKAKEEKTESLLDAFDDAAHVLENFVVADDK
jgi:PleD family two-component response regulator